MSTVFMYHPLIPSTTGEPVRLPSRSLEHYLSLGWLEVNPSDPPAVITPYLTQAAGDSRYVRDTELAAQSAAHVSDGSALDDALRADFVTPADVPLAVAAPPPPGQLKVIDTFQAGHTWTQEFGAAGTDLNATTDPAIGSQYLRMVTPPNSGTCRITRSGVPAVNMTGRKFAVLMRITGTTNLDSIVFYAGSTNFTNHDQFQFDRYLSDREKAWFREGEWTWMVFSRESLWSTSGTSPRAAYTDFRFAFFGYNSGMTVDIAALASVSEPTTFPSGVVSFTCDDGRRSQFTTVRPVLDRYLFPATAYVIADQIGLPPQQSTLGFEGPMTMAELRQLQDTSRWEIAAHASTAANHDAPGGFTSLTAEALDEENRAMKAWLRTNGFRGGDHLAYPQGCYSPTVLDRTRAWYGSGRALNGYTNDTYPPSNVYKIRTGFTLSAGASLAAAKARVDRNVAGKGWLVFCIHRIAATGADSLTWLTSDFDQLVDYVAASGAAVHTVGDVLARR